MSRFPALSVCAALVAGLVWGALSLPRSVSAASATAAADLELRASPAFEAPVSLIVPAGAPLSLDGSPEGDFYPVTFEGTAGWVPASGLIVVKDEPDAMDPGLAEPAPAETGASEPDPASIDPTPEPTAAPPPSATAPPEATAAPVEPEPTIPSVAVTTSVSAEPVATSAPTEPIAPPASTEPAAVATEVPPAPAEAVAVSTGTPAPTSESPPPPAEALSPTTEAAAAPTPVVAATAAPTPSPTATPLPVVRGPATASVNAALLANPQRGSALLFTVPAGSTVTRTGSYVNGFVSADFMGIAGWLDFDLLAEPLPPRAEEAEAPADAATAVPTPTATPESTATPVPTAAPEPTARPERTARPEPSPVIGVGGPGSGVAYASRELSLRSGPSASYPELSTIGAGEPMALTGVMEGGFVRVEYGGEIGWVATTTLSMPVDPTPVTAPRGTASRRVFSREEIVRVIYAAADRFGQPRADMLRVAECESNLDPYAVNASGSYGLFQFVASTWESTPYANKDVFDPKANANAAAWMWSVGRRNEWVCQ
jgi:uncharacterized protein YraI